MSLKTPSNYSYDITLIYDESDRAIVEEVFQKLQIMGFKPSRCSLKSVSDSANPNPETMNLLYSGVCAIFIGRDSFNICKYIKPFSPLTTIAKSPDFRLIPVLLSPLDRGQRGQLPSFLTERGMLDFKNGINDPDTFRHLICGILGISIDAFSSRNAVTSEEVYSYHRLQPFEDEHTRLFFGHEYLTQQIIAHLQTNRLAVVTGEPGTGKSSLVRVGVIPSLYQSASPGGDRWKMLTLKPGGNPLRMLATTIMTTLLPGMSQETELVRFNNLLSSDQRVLTRAIHHSIVHRIQSTRILIFVDQFEELFTLCDDKAEQQAFLDNLIYAVNDSDSQVSVIITVRSNSLTVLASQYPNWASALSSTQFEASLQLESLPRPLKPVLSPPINAQETPANMYGLLIGINAYQSLNPLARAANDATDLFNLLRQRGYPAQNTILLTDDQATKRNINDRLDYLARQIKPTDIFVLFFAGHGARRVGGFEVGEYLCPLETDWDSLRSTAISDEELSSALHKIQAQRVIVLLDACHAGGVGQRGNPITKPGLSEGTYDRLGGEGRVIIASCKPDEFSWELAEMSNGLFTHYLLEGLRGAAADESGQVGVLRLFDYVSKKVVLHKPQHPILKVDKLTKDIQLVPIAVKK